MFRPVCSYLAGTDAWLLSPCGFEALQLPELWERLASACCVSWQRPSKIAAMQPLVLVLEDLLE